MKISNMELTNQVSKLCANYYRAVTSDVTDLFLEEFADCDEAIFKRAVKSWITSSDTKFPSVGQLKKKYWDVKRAQEVKAESLAYGGVLPCQFRKFPEKPGWVDCVWSRKLCCSNDFRIKVSNSYVCEFHYVLLQEWSDINHKMISWLGEYGHNWTAAEILKLQYQSGNLAEKSEILMKLTREQYDFVTQSEGLLSKLKTTEKLGSEVFEMMNSQMPSNDQILAAKLDVLGGSSHRLDIGVGV